MNRAVKTFEQFDNSVSDISNVDLKKMHDLGMLSSDAYIRTIVHENRFDKTNTALLIKHKTTERVRNAEWVMTFNDDFVKLSFFYNFMSATYNNFMIDKNGKVEEIDDFFSRFGSFSTFLFNTVNELGADFM